MRILSVSILALFISLPISATADYPAEAPSSGLEVLLGHLSAFKWVPAKEGDSVPSKSVVQSLHDALTESPVSVGQSCKFLGKSDIEECQVSIATQKGDVAGSLYIYKFRKIKAIPFPAEVSLEILL